MDSRTNIGSWLATQYIGLLLVEPRFGAKSVTAPILEGRAYVVTYYPTGARSVVVERDDDNLTAE